MQLSEEELKKDIKNVVNTLAKIAEEDGFDTYWFYSELLNGDFIVRTFFEEYFKKKEGIVCCCDKASYVLSSIKKMIETKNDIKLQQTYREYQENGGDIGSIKELDRICYWCPNTIKTSKEAIELFYKATLQKWIE